MNKKTLARDGIHDIGGVKFNYEKTTPYIWVSIGSEKKRIKKNDLWMLVFMMSKGKTQDQLIPVWEKEMVQFTRQHYIKATRDIKEGETIQFHCDVNVPKIVVDSLLAKEGVTPTDVMVKAEELPKDTLELERAVQTS